MKKGEVEIYQCDNEGEFISNQINEVFYLIIFLKNKKYLQLNQLVKELDGKIIHDRPRHLQCQGVILRANQTIKECYIIIYRTQSI